MPTTPAVALSRSVSIEAPADRVWQLVSDLPAMGELSPENTGGSWLGGATGPAAGVRFKGKNSQGKRRWSTDVTVTECEPGRRFAFDVKSVGLAVATWSYDIEATGDDACQVTESWQDNRGWLISTLGSLTTGVSDRKAFAATSIEQTLARLKERAEQPF
ncbi:MAG: SRPBCC family protein [Mycobacteriales bacterium]